MNDECSGHIQGIVYSNIPVLYSSMHLGEEKNVAEESFHFLWTKNLFFILRPPRIRKEAVQIWNRVASKFAHDILKNIFLVSQVSIV